MVGLFNSNIVKQILLIMIIYWHDANIMLKCNIIF